MGLGNPGAFLVSSLFVVFVVTVICVDDISKLADLILEMICALLSFVEVRFC